LHESHDEQLDLHVPHELHDFTGEVHGTKQGDPQLFVAHGAEHVGE
jgi:hypothetical protein